MGVTEQVETAQKYNNPESLNQEVWDGCSENFAASSIFFSNAKAKQFICFVFLDLK